VVTDKLPYEVAFRSINVSSALGPSSSSISGDLIYIRFEEIPAASTGFITISVTAPTEAPTTIYNIANIRYGNDPHPDNNRMTISTYVPLLGYDQLGGGGRADWQWSFREPSSPGGLRLPELPERLAAALPSAHPKLYSILLLFFSP